MTYKMQKKMEEFIYDLIEDTNRSNIIINGNSYNKIEISNACDELLTIVYKNIQLIENYTMVKNDKERS